MSHAQPLNTTRGRSGTIRRTGALGLGSVAAHLAFLLAVGFTAAVMLGLLP